jgi:hypothetical protein
MTYFSSEETTSSASEFQNDIRRRKHGRDLIDDSRCRETASMVGFDTPITRSALESLGGKGVAGNKRAFKLH